MTGSPRALRPSAATPVAAGEEELAWPGLFAFRVGDLVAGLGLGGYGGRGSASMSAGGGPAAGPALGGGGGGGDVAGAAAPAGGSVQEQGPGQGQGQAEGEQQAGPLGVGQPGQGEGHQGTAQRQGHGGAGLPRIVQPEIVWGGFRAAGATGAAGGDGACGAVVAGGSAAWVPELHGSTGAGREAGSVSHCGPSTQLVATPRRLVLLGVCGAERQQGGGGAGEGAGPGGDAVGSVVEEGGDVPAEEVWQVAVPYV